MTPLLSFPGVEPCATWNACVFASTTGANMSAPDWTTPTFDDQCTESDMTLSTIVSLLLLVSSFAITVLWCIIRLLLCCTSGLHDFCCWCCSSSSPLPEEQPGTDVVTVQPWTLSDDPDDPTTSWRVRDGSIIKRAKADPDVGPDDITIGVTSDYTCACAPDVVPLLWGMLASVCQGAQTNCCTPSDDAPPENQDLGHSLTNRMVVDLESRVTLGAHDHQTETKKTVSVAIAIPQAWTRWYCPSCLCLRQPPSDDPSLLLHRRDVVARSVHRWACSHRGHWLNCYDVVTWQTLPPRGLSFSDNDEGDGVTEYRAEDATDVSDDESVGSRDNDGDSDYDNPQEEDDQDEEEIEEAEDRSTTGEHPPIAQNEVRPWQNPQPWNVVRRFKYSCAGLTLFLNDPSSSVTLAIVYFCSILQLFFAPGLSLKLIGLVLLQHAWTTELLNTAIELTVDRIGTEYSPLSRDAKDMAAGASMQSMVVALIVFFGSMMVAYNNGDAEGW